MKGMISMSTHVESQYYESVAQGIVQWLGGVNRLNVMINARNFVWGKTGRGSLLFNFSGCRTYNSVEISLNHKDLYTVRFFKFHGGRIIREKVYEDYYGDSLKTLFTQVTGLYLTL